MTQLKDIKEALGTVRKPDLTHVRYAFSTYVSRPCEYGCDKYERANYLRSTGDGPHDVPTKADVERLRVYLRAMISHGMLVLDSLERHQANDPNFEDVEGLKKAAYAVDTDFKPGQKVGPSLLPHIAMCGSSLMMAIEQAVDCGLLPRDPGTPWRDAPAAPSDEALNPIKAYRPLEKVLRERYTKDLSVSSKDFSTDEKPFAVPHHCANPDCVGYDPQMVEHATPASADDEPGAMGPTGNEAEDAGQWSIKEREPQGGGSGGMNF